MDQTEVPDDLRQKWHEAQANRRMQFKVGTFKSSEIHMITCTLKADSIQLPVENYLAKFPTLKQGVIAGVFKIKGASAWAITRAEKLQVSLFLPNKQWGGSSDWMFVAYAMRGSGKEVGSSIKRQHFNDDSSFGSCDHNVFDTVQLTDPAYLSYQKKK